MALTPPDQTVTTGQSAPPALNSAAAATPAAPIAPQTRTPVTPANATPQEPAIDPGFGGAMSGFGGLFKILALLFLAFMNPKALQGSELEGGLAGLLGFDGVEGMNSWRSNAGGSFRKAYQTANWDRIDSGRIDQEYHKYAKLVDSGNPMLELLGKHESGGDYNRAFGRGIFRPSINGKPLTESTINEVIAWQRQYTSGGSDSSAAGKYQIIRKTLEATKQEMGLTGNEKFDARMQDRMALHLLNKRGLDDFVAGRMDEKTLVRNISKEWASMPNINGRSYYDGDGLNASAKGITPETVAAVARLTRDRQRDGGGIALASADPVAGGGVKGADKAARPTEPFKEAATSPSTKPRDVAAAPTVADATKSEINVAFNNANAGKPASPSLAAATKSEIVVARPDEAPGVPAPVARPGAAPAPVA